MLIGAGAVVITDLPDAVQAAGVPAKILKQGIADAEGPRDILSRFQLTADNLRTHPRGAIASE